MCPANSERPAAPRPPGGPAEPPPVTPGASVFLDSALARMIHATESEYGFVADVLSEPHGSPYFAVRARAGLGWTDATRKFYDEWLLLDSNLVQMRSRFREVVVSAATLRARDPVDVDDLRGFPAGHPPIRALLATGVGPEGDPCGTVVLANRPLGFDDAVVASIAPSLTTVGLALATDRADMACRGAERALSDATERARRTGREFAAALGRDGRPRAVGAGSRAEIVRDYVRQFPARAAEIRAARDDGDLAALRTLVHRLRGTGATLGFPSISLHARVLDELILAGLPMDQLSGPIDVLLLALSPPDA